MLYGRKQDLASFQTEEGQLAARQPMACPWGLTFVGIIRGVSARGERVVNGGTWKKMQALRKQILQSPGKGAPTAKSLAVADSVD
jgi:hypothetical protein